MKNIEYLEEFFRKHNLKGKVRVQYQGTNDDDNMNTIILDNDITIKMSDVSFDIDSELEPMIGDKWLKSGKTQEITLVEWLTSGQTFIPDDIDTSSVEEYHKELEEIVEEVKKSFDKMFEFEEEGGDE